MRRKKGADRFRRPLGGRFMIRYFFLGVVFFAGGAAGFLYSVLIESSIDCSMLLAASAFGPSRFNCKYFWKASLVPSGGLILPGVASTAALPLRQVPALL